MKARIDNMKKNIITGTTEDGFRYEINRDVLEDYEFVKLSSEVAGGNPQAFPKLLRFTLGEEQETALLEFLREKDEKGIAKTTEVASHLNEIFGKIKEAKN